jgi:hypothetical protein
MNDRVGTHFNPAESRPCIVHRGIDRLLHALEAFPRP